MRHNSRTVFACHEYLHKTLAPSRFDLSLRITDDPFSEALKKAGIDYEETVLGYLKSLNLKLKILDTSLSIQLWEQNTARAIMNPDIDIIYGASIGDYCEKELAKLQNVDELGDPLRVSRPDLLIKVGASANGYPVWAPVDIKSHDPLVESKSNNVHVTKWPAFNPKAAEIFEGRIREDDALQLAHYLRHLQALGLADDSTWAGILGTDESFITWVDLNALTFGKGANAQNALLFYEMAFQDAVGIKEQSRAREKDPLLPPVTIPRRISACTSCEMRKVCRSEMEAFDDGAGHVTLLSLVTAGKADAHLNGIESIGELATTHGLDTFGTKAALRAKVWIDKVPVLLDPSKEFGLPTFDIEIDIDLENSQAALQELELEDSAGRDVLYLYGYGIHDRTIDPDWRTAVTGYFDDYSDTDESEFKIFSQMWGLLEEEVARAEAAGRSVGIFHYGSHEQTWWRKYPNLHAAKKGAPTLDHVEAFMSKYFVNLQPITQRVVLPVTGYSIKTLAPFVGFEWEVAEAGGANSMIMYQTAISPTTTAAGKADAIEWLRRYNRDDIRATFAVRDYLRGLQL